MILVRRLVPCGETRGPVNLSGGGGFSSLIFEIARLSLSET
jgi:hypothetical protein